MDVARLAPIAQMFSRTRQTIYDRICGYFKVASGLLFEKLTFFERIMWGGPMPALDFKVGSTAETWRVQVDDAEVTLVDGKGRLEVKANDDVILQWWMGGNPGSTISIEVKRGSKVLWSVEKDSIPVGSFKAWGIVTMRVPA